MSNNKKVYIHLSFPLLRKEYQCLFDTRFTMEENLKEFYELMNKTLIEKYSSFDHVQIYEPVTHSWLNRNSKIAEMNLKNGISLIVY